MAVGRRAVRHWQPGKLHWVPVGSDRGNGGRIKLAGEPMNPLAERLVNGMESLIELARLRELMKNSDRHACRQSRATPCCAISASRSSTPSSASTTTSAREKRALADKVRKNLSITLDFEKKVQAVRRHYPRSRHGPGARQCAQDAALARAAPTKPTSPTSSACSARAVHRHSRSPSTPSSSLGALPISASRATDAGAGWTIVREIQPKGRRDPLLRLPGGDGGRRACRTSMRRKPTKPASCRARTSATSVTTSARPNSAIARSMYQSLNHVLFNPVMPYELFALKDTPEPMLGTAQRLARRVRMLGRGSRARQVVRRAAGDLRRKSWPKRIRKPNPLLFDDLPVADLGTISIRVFVLPPKPKKGTEKQVALPLDVEEGEEFMLDEKGATPGQQLSRIEPRQALRRLPRQWPAAGVRRQQLHRAGPRLPLSARPHDDHGGCRRPGAGGDRPADAGLAAGLLSRRRARGDHQAHHRHAQRAIPTFSVSSRKPRKPSPSFLPATRR